MTQLKFEGSNPIQNPTQDQWSPNLKIPIDQALRTPAPWEISGGLLDLNSLQTELTQTKDIGRIGDWRLKFSIALLKQSEWSILSEVLAERKFPNYITSELRTLSRLIEYSPIMELEPFLYDLSAPFYQFYSNSRMYRQMWTDTTKKGPNYQSWEAMLKTAEELKVVAHGTWGNFSNNLVCFGDRAFQHQWALLSIMYDGAVSAGDGGMLTRFDKNSEYDPFNAADYGPFYVIFEPGYRNISRTVHHCGFSNFMGQGPSQRDQHKAYLIPDESFRPFFEKALRILEIHQFLSSEIVKQELSKILTYRQWVEIGPSMLSK